jgi:hypothetical protein
VQLRAALAAAAPDGGFGGGFGGASDAGSFGTRPSLLSRVRAHTLSSATNHSVGARSRSADGAGFGAAAALPGGARSWLIPFGALTLEEMIGYGVQSKVFRARYGSQRVAAKRTRWRVDNDSIAEMMRSLANEAQALAALRHPHIVQVACRRRAAAAPSWAVRVGRLFFFAHARPVALSSRAPAPVAARLTHRSAERGYDVTTRARSRSARWQVLTCCLPSLAVLRALRLP